MMKFHPVYSYGILGESGVGVVAAMLSSKEHYHSYILHEIYKDQRGCASIGIRTHLISFPTRMLLSILSSRPHSLTEHVGKLRAKRICALMPI